MSRNRTVLDTPVGKVRTVTVNNARYYLIKDVCAGLGLTGHSPWSWHAKEADNKQRFYSRYDLQRKCATSGSGRHNTATIITYEGLMDYLSSATIRNRPQAIMFRMWLDGQTPEEDRVPPVYQSQLPLEQVAAPAETAQAANDAAVPLLWIVEYTCPACGFSGAKATQFCPDSGAKLGGVKA